MIFSWFKRDPYLWKCPITHRYHDPSVLVRALANVQELSTIREYMGWKDVTPDGRGVSDQRAEEVYAEFIRWLEKKGWREPSSPTSAQSTDSLQPSVEPKSST